VPARPYRARDKAKVEVAVQIATRFIIAKLRNRRFFSLAALNTAIAELVVQINNRTSRHLGASRRALFVELERSALKPLPSEPYLFAEWKECRVGLDYHIEIDKHYYSVPHQLLKIWHHGAHRRSLPPRQARCRACAFVIQPQAHNGARAHVTAASGR
jgi:transposase